MKSCLNWYVPTLKFAVLYTHDSLVGADILVHG